MGGEVGIEGIGMDREVKGKEREGSNTGAQETRSEKQVAQIRETKSDAQDVPTAGLMTIEEASVFLNLKVSKLRAMVFRKEIPFIKIGRLVRFHAQDLETWLLARRSAQSGFIRSPHGSKNKSLFEIDTHFSKANSKGLP